MRKRDSFACKYEKKKIYIYIYIYKEKKKQRQIKGGKRRGYLLRIFCAHQHSRHSQRIFSVNDQRNTCCDETLLLRYDTRSRTWHLIEYPSHQDVEHRWFLRQKKFTNLRRQIAKFPSVCKNSCYSSEVTLKSGVSEPLVNVIRGWYQQSSLYAGIDATWLPSAPLYMHQKPCWWNSGGRTRR